MRRKILVFSADATAFIHGLVYIVATLGLVVAIVLYIVLCCQDIAGQEPNAQLLKVPTALMIYIIELLTITGVGQALFEGDCPIRIFEYCLRAYAGQEFSFGRRCHTMKQLVTATDYPARPSLYRRLLWQSGAFFAAAVAVLIAPQIVIILI